MMNLQEVITEMELKRARSHISFRKIALNLGAKKEEYLGWINNESSPNLEQVKLIMLWISDQLQLVEEEKEQE